MSNNKPANRIIRSESIEDVRDFYERMLSTSYDRNESGFLAAWPLVQSLQCFVAEIGGYTVGSITLCEDARACGYSLDVVFVDPDFRKQGIARALIERALWYFDITDVELVEVNARTEAVAKIVHGLKPELRKLVDMQETWRLRNRTPAQRDANARRMIESCLERLKRWSLGSKDALVPGVG